MKSKAGVSKELLVIVMMIVLFVSISFLSLTSIKQLQGNARVVNYVGIVRGATQKLIKIELYGNQDETLLEWLDSIVGELLTGEGPNDLIVLQDDEYLNHMRQVQAFWEEIKIEIQEVRGGKDSLRLYEMSEDYFTLVNNTVTAAEVFSEQQVRRTNNLLRGIIGVFVLLIVMGVVYYVSTAAIKQRAEALGKIAYVDPLTQMPNRASCEEKMDYLTKNPPESNIALLMFDMNNLKLVNDTLGHLGGDRLIADFARIIKTEALDDGFVCRFGGDEFMAIFENADEGTVERYLTRINEKILASNLLHVNEVEKISFAVGYVLGNLRENNIIDLIKEADRRMYLRKRQMKENR